MANPISDRKVISYFETVTEVVERKVTNPGKVGCTHVNTVWAKPTATASYRRTICIECGELVGYIPTV